ncbi:uncharacterized protein N7498_007657 [Penicillium cinerascens]|uniref:Uncharacterized protein n=1 Tax=Penicillium cinerascens TaxID=70096 RepID=A0A9W9JP86_9EURO|nr:uncharacterized protein N7498_007657 [Penicillium cinerascens]KAJ5198540.1 hypothetical protein N7498_007657 [Penicillium cinerascens]
MPSHAFRRLQPSQLATISEDDNEQEEWIQGRIPHCRVMQAVGWRIVDDNHVPFPTHRSSDMYCPWSPSEPERLTSWEAHAWVIQEFTSYLELVKSHISHGSRGSNGSDSSHASGSSQGPNGRQQYRRVNRYLEETVPPRGLRSRSPSDSDPPSDSDSPPGSGTMAEFDSSRAPTATRMWAHILALHPSPIHKVLWARVLQVDEEGKNDDIDSLIETFKSGRGTQDQESSQNNTKHQSRQGSNEPNSEQRREMCGYILALMDDIQWLIRNIRYLDPVSPIARMTVFIFVTQRIPLWGDPIDAFPTPGHVTMFAENGPRAVSDDICDAIFQNVMREGGMPTKGLLVETLNFVMEVFS